MLCGKQAPEQIHFNLTRSAATTPERTTNKEAEVSDIPSHILDAMIRRSKSRDYSLLLTVDLHAACRDASGRLHIFWPVLRSAHPRSDLTRWWREKVTRRDSVVADVSRCEIRWISSMVGKKTMAQSIPSRREVGRVMNRQCISCK